MKIKPFDNLLLKLVAFILAIIVWFLVVGERRSEVRLSVPIEIRNLPEHLEIVHQSVNQVEVAIRGVSNVVKRLTPGDVDVHIELHDIKEGSHSFALFPNDIVVPVGATVIQVSPSDVTVTLDATSNKIVGVRPIIRGIPAEGYMLGEIAADPKTITLTGAQNLLDATAKIDTEAIIIENLTESLVKKVKLRLPNGIRVGKEEEKTITVSVKIDPKMVDLFFEDIPLLVKDETRPYTVSPQVITALLYGPELTLLHLKPTDIPVFIETAKLPEGQSVVQPIFKLPEALSVKRYYPKTITITIQGGAS